MTKIKKAVIAAAGRGTRFLPVVKSYAKELVPVLAKPNIQLLVEELIGAGISEICIVHRNGETGIKNYFTPDADLEKYLKNNNKTSFLDSLREIWDKVKIMEFIPQPLDLPYGNASPALAAETFIGHDPFVYLFGDDLIIEPKPGQFLTEMLATYDKFHPDAVMATQQVPWEEIIRYGCIKYKDNPKHPNQVETVVEKMPPDDAPSNNAVLGRFVVSNKILENIKRQAISRDNELWWADAINELAQTGVVLNQTIKHGEWMTTGDPLRWLKANIAIALQEPKYSADLKEFIQKITQIK